MSRATSGRDVGPSDSASRCYHGDVTFAIDPDPVYLRHCDESGVFWAPIDAVTGPIHCCPYHLARYLEAADEDLEAELVARGAREYAADPAFVTIDDAPDDYEMLGQSFILHSIDQRGHAHYVQPGECVIELLPTFELQRVTPLEEISIEAYMERLRRDRGFAAFAPGVGLPTGGTA